jgi:HEAT repeat protein
MQSHSNQPSSDPSIKRLIDTLKAAEEHSEEWFAARIDLLRLGAELVLNPLTTILNDTLEGDRNRCTAAGVLSELQDERAALTLASQALNKNASPKVRNCCIWTLEYPGGTQAEKTLASIILDTTENLEIRRTALTSFPSPCTRTGIDTLLMALRDEVKEVRGEAARAISRAQWSGKDERVLAPLVEALNDPDYFVRVGAVGALLALGDNRAVEPLISSLLDVHEHMYVRHDAAEALGELRDARAVEPLLSVLNSGGHRFREQVAETLGKIWDMRAVEPLASILNDEAEHADTRFSAAVALGMLGDGRGIDYLATVALSRGNEAGLRCSAISSLEHIQDERAIPALLTLLRDESTDIRYDATGALGESGDQRAVKALVKMLLEDESWEVRSDAAEGLAKLGDPDSIPHLVAALKDEDHTVRGHAATSLGVLGGVKQFDTLLNILNDKSEDGYTRSCAAKGLASIGDKRATESLLQALQEEDFFVLYGAAKALGVLGDLSILPALEFAYQRVKYRSWADERVADSIAEIKVRFGRAL